MTTIDLAISWVLMFAVCISLVGLVDYITGRNKNK